MKDAVMKRNNSGISLITVIITVVVIIILSGIVIYSQFYTVDSAVYAKFVQEYEEVKTNVETIRIGNTKQDIANIDDGFLKVKVEGDIPQNFISIGEGENQAYLVDLNLIGCDALTTGRAYKNYLALEEENRIVTFGEDDVYVYDSRGRLYYVKGIVNDGATVYEALNTNKNPYIRIKDISQMLNGGKTASTITVTIESENSADVMIGGTLGTAVSGKTNTFERTVTQNGTYEIVAKDEEGNTARDKITVTGIGGNDRPTVTAEVVNKVGEEAGRYVINQKTVELKLTSPTAKMLYISTEMVNQANITEWLAYADNVERYFNEVGNKTLYIYVKDENGNWNETPYEVELTINIDDTRPVAPQVEIKQGEIVIARDDEVPDPTEEPWARHGDYAKYKEYTIQFPENMQSGGYKSSYTLKTGLNANWTDADNSKVRVRITKNKTTIKARVNYATLFASSKGDIASGEVQVTGIDENAPTITSLQIQGGNYIVGTAQEAEVSGIESGLSNKPYLIMMNYVDFNVVSVGNYTWTDNNAVQITESGKYYFYARDNVGNVAVKSIYAEAPDTQDPIIDSITQTPIEDKVILRIVAHDDVGITKYGMVQGSTQEPTWIDIDEIKQYVREETITTDTDCTIWVQDAAGHKVSKTVTVITNKYPTLDQNYPEDIYQQEGTQADLKIVIAQPGYPDLYYYQWYVSKDNGDTWEMIIGATSPTYRILNLALEQNGELYRCEVTNDRGTVKSKAASIGVVRISADKPSVEVSLEKEPILGGVIINDGAKTTTSSLLSIKVVGVNIQEVHISEDASLDATTIPSNQWQRCSERMQYTLNSDTEGTKTIYVRAKDDQGNIINKVVSEQIEKQ